MLKDCDNLESEGEEHSSKNISLPFVALGGGHDSDFFSFNEKLFFPLFTCDTAHVLKKLI